MREERAGRAERRRELASVLSRQRANGEPTRNKRGSSGLGRGLALARRLRTRRATRIARSPQPPRITRARVTAPARGARRDESPRPSAPGAHGGAPRTGACGCRPRARALMFLHRPRPPVAALRGRPVPAWRRASASWFASPSTARRSGRQCGCSSLLRIFSLRTERSLELGPNAEPVSGFRTVDS